MKRLVILAPWVALILLSLLPLRSAQAAELVMVEQPGCYYCQLWDSEIASIYPKTAAGKFAPLRREQLRALPTELTFTRPVSYTPTFVLIQDNTEIGRLEGYPGKDFFWWHIETMLEKRTTFTKPLQ
jgi:thioredoxin-related protein